MNNIIFLSIHYTYFNPNRVSQYYIITIYKEEKKYLI